MKLLRRAIISFGVVSFVVCCAAVLLTGMSTSSWQLLSVPTASMQPSISSGSLALVRSVSDSSLKVGDVITYTNPVSMKGTITHRIVRIDKLKSGPPTFVTKGDANKLADPLPAIGGLIQGKVTAHVPYAGSWLLWAKTWWGISFLVYLPASILMFAEIRRLSAYWRLTMPKDYRLFGYPPKETVASSVRAVRYAAAGLAVSFVGASAVFALPVYALFTSNVVSLQPNTLKVAATPNPNPSPPSTTTCTNNTNISVTNNSNQTATSGSASNTNNTTGGNATSGSASNSNTTNVNTNVTNGC